MNLAESDSPSRANWWKGTLCGLSAGFFWGFSFLVPKVLSDYRASQIALGRFFFFGVVSLALLALDWRNVRKWLTWRIAGLGLTLSLAGYSLYYVMLSEAIALSGITTASLIIGLLPLSISLASRSRPERLWLFRSSLLLIAVGILFLNADAIRSLFGAQLTVSWPGIGLSVLALIAWTWFAVANARFLQLHGSRIPGAGWTNLLGAFSLFGMIAYVLVEQTVFPGTAEKGALAGFLSTSFLFWTGFIGLGSTWLATVLWNLASASLPTSLTGQLIVSETLFALLFGFLYEGKLPSTLETAAIVTLVAGVSLGITSFRPHGSPNR